MTPAIEEIMNNIRASGRRASSHERRAAAIVARSMDELIRHRGSVAREQLQFRCTLYVAALVRAHAARNPINRAGPDAAHEAAAAAAFQRRSHRGLTMHGLTPIATGHSLFTLSRRSP